MIDLYDTESGETVAILTFDPYEYELVSDLEPVAKDALDRVIDAGQMNRTSDPSTSTSMSDVPVSNVPTSPETYQTPSTEHIKATLARQLKPAYRLREIDERSDAQLAPDDFDPTEHPRNDDGEFTSVPGSIREINDLAKKVEAGETSDTTGRRKMENLVRDNTDVNLALRTLPGEIDKAARASKELIRLSETEDLSGLDRFEVTATSDDLKGLQGVASGRYKIREKKIVINPDQFEQETINEWREANHSVGTEPESTIRHEVGHFLHGEKLAPLNPEAEFNWEDIKADFDQDITDTIESELGEYAAVMPGEFVAEAFTYQKEGGDLSDELEALYERWNGPEVK